jgi:hypothetical protein
VEISFSLVFFHDDGSRCALPCGLTDFLFQGLRDNVHQDPGDKLVFIIFKDFGADLVAVAIAHAQVIINFYFHRKFQGPNPFSRSRERNWGH